MLNKKRIQELLSKLSEQKITGADITSLMRNICMIIPEDLQEWLKMWNQPTVPPGLLRIGSWIWTLESVLDARPLWKSKKWIPIANDGCGNYYVVATQGEYGEGFPVFFIDTMESEEEPAYIVASDTGHFLEFFLEAELGEERWSFDREYVTRKDPDILKFKKDLLPWEVDRKRANEI